MKIGSWISDHPNLRVHDGGGPHRDLFCTVMVDEIDTGAAALVSYTCIGDGLLGSSGLYR